jgi:hypothetical protein
MEIEIKVFDELAERERVVYFNTLDAEAADGPDGAKVAECHWLNCRFQITVKE